MNQVFRYSLIFIVFTAAGCRKDESPDPKGEPINPQDTIQSAPDSLTEDNLLMGNPSNATTSLLMPDNYLLVKKQFTVSYNNSAGHSNWSAWHLSTAWVGNEPRCDCFSPDFTLPGSFNLINTTHYSGSGFDRGHLCPSADRNKTSSDNAATFLMTNIIAQAPALNQGQWSNLEDYCRILMNAGHELYIYAGGFGSGGTGSLGGVTQTLAGGQVTVPAFLWKVVVVLAEGSDDVSRVDANTRVITVAMPNTQAANTTFWGLYRISVDSLESLTAYDFLSAVPAGIQSVIEAAADTGPTQ